jgi:putative sterol carrier protein
VYKFAGLGVNRNSEIKSGPIPKFGVFTIGENAIRFHEGSLPSVGKVTVSAWFDSLEEQAHRLPALEEEVVVQFDFSGENGRRAYLMQSGADVGLVDGTYHSPNATITAEASDWLALLNGEISPEFSFLEGKIKILGSLDLVMQLAGAISLSPPGTYQSDKWRLDIDYLDVVRVSLSS